eukprot:1158748-Pelagomonas_calceolata.AAC.23
MHSTRTATALQMHSTSSPPWDASCLAAKPAEPCLAAPPPAAAAAGRAVGQPGMRAQRPKLPGKGPPGTPQQQLRARLASPGAAAPGGGCLDLIRIGAGVLDLLCMDWMCGYPDQP